VAAGAKGACAMGGTFQVWHFKEDEKFSACVQSFKCITALDIRPVRCSVTFKMHQPNSSTVRAPPHTYARELPKLLAGSGTSGKEGRQDVRLP